MVILAQRDTEGGKGSDALVGHGRAIGIAARVEVPLFRARGREADRNAGLAGEHAENQFVWRRRHQEAGSAGIAGGRGEGT